MIRTTAVVDRYERDGRVLLLFPNQLIEPGPVAAAIADLAADGIEFDDLVLALVARLGAPGEGSARELVRTCVEELAAHGMLTVEGDPG
ncbi:MAG: hypothetical protein ACK5LS_02040 [Propioniciclava sp.]